MDNVVKFRHELLTRMCDELQEELIACEIREPQAEGEPEILTAVIDGMGEAGEKEGIIGEFFFIPPSSEEDTVQLFAVVLTLLDDIDKTRLPELYEAMSHFNYFIPCGCYCIDREASYLAYRLMTPMSAELSEEALYEEMNICVANAIAAADIYLEQLIKTATGEIQ